MFGNEIDITAIHAVEVLSQKYGQLIAEDLKNFNDWLYKNVCDRFLAAYIDNPKHVGEGHVCEDEENCSIDVHDTFLVVILVQVDNAQN